MNLLNLSKRTIFCLKLLLVITMLNFQIGGIVIEEVIY